MTTMERAAEALETVRVLSEVLAKEWKGVPTWDGDPTWVKWQQWLRNLSMVQTNVGVAMQRIAEAAVEQAAFEAKCAEEWVRSTEGHFTARETEAADARKATE